MNRWCRGKGIQKNPEKNKQMRNLNKAGTLIKSYLGSEEVLLEAGKIANPVNSTPVNSVGGGSHLGHVAASDRMISCGWDTCDVLIGVLRWS